MKTVIRTCQNLNTSYNNGHSNDFATFAPRKKRTSCRTLISVLECGIFQRNMFKPSRKTNSRKQHKVIATCFCRSVWNGWELAIFNLFSNSLNRKTTFCTHVDVPWWTLSCTYRIHHESDMNTLCGSNVNSCVARPQLSVSLYLFSALLRATSLCQVEPNKTCARGVFFSLIKCFF